MKTRTQSTTTSKKSAPRNSGFTFRALFHRRALLCEKRTARAGFTLVEMIVAVFIFTVVMLIAVSALMGMLDANRRAQATKTVMNNLQFSLESMTREIRMGTGYKMNRGTAGLEFTDKDGCEVTYRKSDVGGKSAIVRDLTKPGGVSSCTKTTTSNIEMTAPEVQIERLEFYVGGTTPGDIQQPHVTIIVGGVAGDSVRTRVPFNLQTFVTQRFFDRADS